MITIIPATPTVVPAGMFPDFPDCSFLSAQKSLEKKIENKQHRSNLENKYKADGKSDNDDDDGNKQSKDDDDLV